MSESGNNLDLEDQDAPAAETGDFSNEAVPLDDLIPSNEIVSPEPDAPSDGATPSDEIAPPPKLDSPSEDLRARLVAQFERWLDGMLSEESEPPVPEEIIAEAIADTASDDPGSTNTDLFTLFAALTKLSGEIGMQGRTFGKLTDALAPVAQLPAAIEQLEEAQFAAAGQFDRLAEQLQPGDSGLPASKEVLAVLFDLLERLERGLKTFEAGIAAVTASRPRGLPARLFGIRRQSDAAPATIQAMHEGYRLTVSRLEAAVTQWGIERIGREGDPFDPETMTAIEVDKSGDHPDGTVVSILRGGYRHQGKILATAQVKVAKE